jgi:hypothetical protein
MRRLPALPLSLGVCARLQALPGALLCAVSSLLLLPLLATLRIVGGRPGCFPLAHPLDTGPLIRHRHIGRCFTFGGAGVAGGGGFGDAPQFAQAATGDVDEWSGAARSAPSPAPTRSPSVLSAPPSSERFPERGREVEVGDLGRHFKALRVSSPLSVSSHTASALRTGDEEDHVHTAVLVEEEGHDPYLRLGHLFFDAPASEWGRHEVPSWLTSPRTNLACLAAPRSRYSSSSTYCLWLAQLDVYESSARQLALENC